MAKAKKKGKAGAGTEASKEKLKRKDYDKELARLHVELVKLQEWVKHKGLKVCIVFEGRDGAGKGGTIKAITERVSPRVFRVIALPAPTEREKSQMYVAALPAALAGGRRGRDLRPQLVQPRRRRAGDGLLHRGGGEEVPDDGAAVREGDGRLRHHPAQVLARGEPGGADPPARSAHRRRSQDLEALADGPQVLQPLVRLLARARRDVRRHRHRLRAVVRRAVRRQEARAPQHHHATCSSQIPYKYGAAREGEAAEAAEGRRLPEPDYPFKFIKERF